MRKFLYPVTLFIFVISIVTVFSETVDFNALLTAEEKTWIQENPIVRIAPDPDFPPIEFIDESGNYKGITAEYIQRIGELSGLQFEVIVLSSWSEILEKAKSKEIDLLGGATFTEERSKYLLFSDSYMSAPDVIIVDSNNTEISSIDELNGLKVAVVSDFAVQEYIETNYPDIKLETVENIEIGLKMVSFNMVDAFIADLAQTSYYIRENSITNLRIASELESEGLSFAVRDDWPELVSIMNKSLSLIPENERAQIFNNWSTFGSTKQEQLTKFFIVISAVLAVTLGFQGVTLLWNRTLKKQVESKTKELEEINKTLEDKVLERTTLLNESNLQLHDSMDELHVKQEELSDTNIALNRSFKDLKDTMTELVETRKNAALDRLVAGVAHEINTPLGNCITSISFLKRNCDQMSSDFESNKLRRSDLKDYLESNSESINITFNNLIKTTELIHRFKKISIEYTDDKIQIFSLRDLIENILLSYNHYFKEDFHEIEFYCPDDLVLYSFPGNFTQIFANLLSNSLMHGFEDSQHGTININIIVIDKELIIDYSDNGKGIRTDSFETLFEPFYTTKRGRGGMGLGLNIINNIVTYILKGSIRASNEPTGGARFIIKIPESEICRIKYD